MANEVLKIKINGVDVAKKAMKPKIEMKNITFRVKSDVADAFYKACKKSGASANNVAGILLEEFLKSFQDRKE